MNDVFASSSAFCLSEYRLPLPHPPTLTKLSTDEMFTLYIKDLAPSLVVLQVPRAIIAEPVATADYDSPDYALPATLKSLTITTIVSLDERRLTASYSALQRPSNSYDRQGMLRTT